MPIYRQGGASRLATPPNGSTIWMDCPDPDYRDYFAALRASSLGPQIEPSLLIESARVPHDLMEEAVAAVGRHK